MNDCWSLDITVITQHCSTLLESICINCRPFYCPREFSSIILACDYIPPDADVDAAQNTLAEQIMCIERKHPESPVVELMTSTRFILAALFRDTGNMSSVLDTLDHCYSTIRQPYHSGQQ